MREGSKLTNKTLNQLFRKLPLGNCSHFRDVCLFPMGETVRVLIIRFGTWKFLKLVVQVFLGVNQEDVAKHDFWCFLLK